MTESRDGGTTESWV